MDTPRLSHVRSSRGLAPYDHDHPEEQRTEQTALVALLCAWEQLSERERIRFLIAIPTPKERRGMLEGLPEDLP